MHCNNVTSSHLICKVLQSYIQFLWIWFVNYLLIRIHASMISYFTVQIDYCFSDFHKAVLPEFVSCSKWQCYFTNVFFCFNHIPWMLNSHTGYTSIFMVLVYVLYLPWISNSKKLCYKGPIMAKLCALLFSINEFIWAFISD